MITKEETKKGIETVLYYGKVQETISALNILIDDIGIKDIKKILEIRDSYDRSDVYPMFDSNRDRKNEHEERKEKIAILKANGITATEDLTKLIKTICVSDMGYLKKILEKYKNITVQQLLSITRILSRPKELDIIFKKYPEISLEDLARIDQTIGKIYDEDERKKIIEQLDIYDEDVEEAAKLFHIIRNYLESETIKEIFDDMEPKDRINEKNRIAATVIYSIISRLPNTTIHDEIKKTINNLFGQEEKENKDFIYENIRRILEKTIEK